MVEMQWCIHDDNGDLAYDTNAPDGVHAVEQTYYNKQRERVTRSFDGVIVKDGKIDIASAMNTINKFLSDEFIPHRFIEKMDWTGDKFIAWCGS